MRYNERIRAIREDSSLTQQKIAELLHIGPRTYADYESGKTRIPVDSLLILAEFYNVSMDYIIRELKKEEINVLDTLLKGIIGYERILCLLRTKNRAG